MPEEDDEPDVYRNPELDRIETLDRENAASVYQNTIKSIRNRTTTQVRSTSLWEKNAKAI